jgi:hypothetical protein
LLCARPLKKNFLVLLYVLLQTVDIDDARHVLHLQVLSILVLPCLVIVFCVKLLVHQTVDEIPNAAQTQRFARMRQVR